MGLEGDDERHSDDRAVDDARDLGRSQMGFDRSAHGTGGADTTREAGTTAIGMRAAWHPTPLRGDHAGMVIAADYPFLDILWTMIIFFVWVVWIWMMISILSDVFRRHDMSGWGKAAWSIFLIVLPFLGALIYLATQSDGMAKRTLEDRRGQQAQMDEYIRSVAGSGGGAAGEIDKAKQLLDSGAIDQAEFEALKAKALA